MNVTDTASDQPVTAAADKSFNVVESAFQLYANGVARLAEIQKKAIDSAVEHNAEVVNAWKKQASAAPGLFMLELASTAFDRFAETQKGAIDLIVEQSHTLAGLVKERKVTATQSIEEGIKKVQGAMNESVAAQKAALDFTAKQTKAVFDTAKQQLGYVGTPVGAAADSMQRGVEVVIEAQKDLLDVLKGPTQIVH
jgi:hypothetical protein